MGLERLLGRLHSDHARSSFLNRVYTPGNAEVADRLIELYPDSSILESEANYAKNNSHGERFLKIAKKTVDYFIKKRLWSSLKDQVNGWNDSTVADYAVTQLEGSDNAYILDSVAEIAQHFGQVERGRKLLERALEIQLKKEGHEYPSARTCVKLGKFVQAIDLFLKAGYHSYDEALKIAQKHVPQRIDEVAEKGFNEYSSSSFHRQGFYLICAEILGKERTAKRRLRHEGKNLVPNSPPRFYEGLVESLTSLNLRKDAREVVRKVSEYQAKRAQEGRIFSFHDEQRELAKLYELIGETIPVRDILLARIDTALKDHWHPSNFERDIDRGYKITGDPIFLQRKLLLLEETGDFQSAAEVALELRDKELARDYLTMHEMVAKDEG